MSDQRRNIYQETYPEFAIELSENLGELDLEITANATVAQTFSKALGKLLPSRHENIEIQNYPDPENRQSSLFIIKKSDGSDIDQAEAMLVGDAVEYLHHIGEKQMNALANATMLGNTPVAFDEHAISNYVIASLTVHGDSSLPELRDYLKEELTRRFANTETIRVTERDDGRSVMVSTREPVKDSHETFTVKTFLAETAEQVEKAGSLEAFLKSKRPLPNAEVTDVASKRVPSLAEAVNNAAAEFINEQLDRPLSNTERDLLHLTLQNAIEAHKKQTTFQYRD